ncbi:MAG: multiheme c-type cytochrome [Verrucomicrobiales bacterium]
MIRLAGILIVGFVAFVFFRNAMIPESWDPSRSFRQAALADIAALPSIHGGNASCVNCHQDEDETHQDSMDELEGGAHNSLSCESCHGPLAHHVADDRKIADARIDYSRLLCINCHGNSVSLPVDFPKFLLADEKLPPNREAQLLEAAVESGSKKIYRHKKDVHNGMDCTECHFSFHDPET